MEHLRNPIKPEADNKLRIQCFGNFEVLSGEIPFILKGQKHYTESSCRQNYQQRKNYHIIADFFQFCTENKYW